MNIYLTSTYYIDITSIKSASLNKVTEEDRHKVVEKSLEPSRHTSDDRHFSCKQTTSIRIGDVSRDLSKTVSHCSLFVRCFKRKKNSGKKGGDGEWEEE